MPRQSAAELLAGLVYKAGLCSRRPTPSVSLNRRHDEVVLRLGIRPFRCALCGQRLCALNLPGELERIVTSEPR